MSGTPHMSGRRDPTESSDPALSVSDLLDDDGSVDPSAIASAANSVAQRDDRVSAAEATTIRQRLIRGRSVSMVADELGRAESTVRQHARGEVEYIRDETPDCPPVEFRDGDGWVVGDE